MVETTRTWLAGAPHSAQEAADLSRLFERRAVIAMALENGELAAESLRDAIARRATPRRRMQPTMRQMTVSAAAA